MTVGGTLGGLGLPATTPSELGAPSPLLADNIDPQTRDFRSLTVGADVVDAQVQFALSVVRGSGAAVQQDGIAAPPDKMLDSLDAELASEARIALKRLVTNGDVRISGTRVLRDDANQFAQLTVDYQNLRTADRRVRSAVVMVPALGAV